MTEDQGGGGRTQSSRVLAVATPLDEDALLLRRVEYDEELARPYTLRLELLSEQEDIDFDELLGHPMAVRLGTTERDLVYLHGLLSDIRQSGTVQLRRHDREDQSKKDTFTVYHATLRPSIWFLSRVRDCRVFQNMTAPDIVKTVLRDAGISNFEDRLNGDYPEHEYCVQYRETQLDFITRLMEREGFYFYFLHDEEQHTLVLADDPDSHDAATEEQEIPFFPDDRQRRVSESIKTWRIDRSLEAGSFVLKDFDFENPTNDLFTVSADNLDHPLGDLETYDYEGIYTRVADGERYAGLRREAVHVRRETVSGESDARLLRAGVRFTLTDPSHALREDQHREYLVTRISIEDEQDRYMPSDHVSVPYACRFEALPALTAFRPDRRTPVPRIEGPQTAIVVGSAGEEFTTDEYGRVKVRFHWDRYGQADETASCWVRVSQPIAGKGWGAIFTPRIGQEVVVSFLDGDPDRPLITGRVYNGEQRTPYDLPTANTISTIKTNSSPGGGGFNELRFEDKAGEEQIFIHAQKNMDIRVLNDRFETVGNDRHLVVDNDKYEHVKNDRHELIDRHHQEKVGADYNLAVEGKQAIRIAESRSLVVGGEVIEKFGDDCSRVVANEFYVKATDVIIEGSDNVTIKVGDSYIAIESGGIKIGTTGDIVLEASGGVTAEAGGDIALDAGGDLSGDAGMNVELEGGIGAKLKGGASADLESDGMTSVSGSMASLSGDGMAEVSGGVVMIN